SDVFFMNQFSISDMKILLNRLLEEEVSIRDMNTILETVADYIKKEKRPLELAKFVRKALLPTEKKEI
ncbi:MAG: flagellar biosynthesis protein FlhA, partial [Treponema sp.]|nr:flagellar biosynthesis protein FlhA [Treponema sp.]